MIGFLTNPLLTKELREEMRSKKIFFVVPVYIALLSIVALVAVGSNTGASFNPLTLSNNARITMYSFLVTISILLGLVTIVLGASSFTTEREKATFELLELTPMSYAELVLGKFLHGFVLICLILLSSLPVISTLFYMGGLTYTDLFLSLFYLAIFFATVLLGAICISIISSRTILSIILSLALGFVISVSLALMTAGVSRNAAVRGFAVISPWLVTWQQIFEPSPLKVAGVDLPVWPFYVAIYGGLCLLFLCWGRNALDTRKLERNPWVRILGLVLINSYAALGILCMRSIAPVKETDLFDLYEALLACVVATLPCFALGSFTDRDSIAFLHRPVLESLSPRRLFLNHPATGVTYLMLLLVSITLTLSLSSAVPISKIQNHAQMLFTWILPWLLLFVSLRLFGLRPRGIFVSYLLGTILYTIIVSFVNVSKPAAKSFSEFYLPEIGVFLLWLISFALFAIAKTRKRLPVHTG